MHLSQKAMVSLWASALLLTTPFLLIVFAAVLAELLGCDIVSSLGAACHIGDINIADVLFGLSVIGWATLVGLPIGLILAPACSIWWWYSLRQERLMAPARKTHI